MRILTFTTLYPSAARPQHGVFVENRLRNLLADCPVQSRVVAPVPWFPFRGERFGEYARYARTPARERRHGIEIEHPRYPLLPKLGMTSAPYLLAAAARPVLRRIQREGYDFDVIDAHYFYPDGVAAAMLGRGTGRPVVITARGTDLNLIPRYRLPRRLIRWAAGQAAALVTVCQALKDELVALGVDPARVTVLRNGVDLRRFSPPQDREQLRERLGAGECRLLSVGHLIPRKGHDLVIEALTRLPPRCRLWIAGDGPERERLADQAARLGLGERVAFLGAVPHDRLAEYYGASDVVVLASSREGWANVLLESMACGTPVAATSVWGTPEVVTGPEAGRLASERTPAAIAQAIAAVLEGSPARSATRAYAERFGWRSTSVGQLELFRAVAKGHAPTMMPTPD